MFAACSKDSDDESTTTQVGTPEHLKDWSPRPKVDTKQPYMTFATSNTSATTLSITVVGNTPTSAVWIDTNNNGVFDEGVDKRITNFNKPVSFTSASGLFTVYGAVKELTVAGNNLTAADVRKNTALNKLNVANNKLSEDALKKLINSLPQPKTNDASVVLYNVDGDGNQVTTQLRNDLIAKGWKAMRLNKGKIEEYTEASIISALNVETLSPTSINVTWSVAPEYKNIMDKLAFQVICQKKNNPTPNYFGVKNALQYKIENLQPNTTYVINLKVTDQAGKSSYYSKNGVEITTSKEETGLEKNVHIALRARMSGSPTKLVALEIKADGVDQEGVWIDLDGNNKWDKDKDIKVTNFSENVTYTIKASNFNIYGKVKMLLCSGNDLSNIDFGPNPYLKDLYTSNNTNLAIKGNNGLKSLSLDSSVLMRSRTLDLSKLTFLKVNETDNFPDGTINTSSMSSLQELDIEECKSIKELDLSKNTSLITLHATNSGLTYLDLTNNTNLQYLMVGGSPLLKIVLGDCKELKDVDVSLDKEGNGLKDIHILSYKKLYLTNFLKKLPDRTKKERKGLIYLSEKQYTNKIYNDLDKKGWVIVKK